MRDKLRASEENNHQMVSFIKSLQTQGDMELSSMRQVLQQKISEDQQNSLKSNEKNSILFNEMVRLGKEYETSQERANQTQLALDERIAQVEARLIGTEQGYLNVDRKGDTN